MTSQWIKIDAASGGTYEAYLSLPPRGRGPGLVLFQEIFGVNRHIRAVADQYALDGYVVLAPDVFWRQAPRIELGYEGAERERGMQLLKEADHGAIVGDIKTTVAALRARSESSGKIGAIGYCFGGRLAYMAAAAAGVDAASSFYGGGIHDNLDKAGAVRCPIQFHYAERDDHIPLAAVEKVKAAFADKTAEVHVYPDAGHGFNCWERGSYHQPSAALAHGRTLVWLAQHLS
jgi:carboxymethylenebutenolidase